MVVAEDGVKDTFASRRVVLVDLPLHDASRYGLRRRIICDVRLRPDLFANMVIVSSLNQPIVTPLKM